MANRNLFPAKALDRKVCSLFGIVTFGASGIVASQDSLGFTVTKSAGTGRYRITLEDRYVALAGLSLVPDNAETAADVKWQMADDGTATTKFIDLDHIGGAASANATSGHKLYITLHLRDSSVGRKGV